MYYKQPEPVEQVTGYHDSLFPTDYHSRADMTPELWATAQKLRIEQILRELSGCDANATFVANVNGPHPDPRYPPYWRVQLSQGHSFAEHNYMTFDAGEVASYPTLAEESAVRMGLKEPRGWRLWPAEHMLGDISRWYYEVIHCGQDYRVDFSPDLPNNVELDSLGDVSTSCEQTFTVQKQENRDDYVAERSGWTHTNAVATTIAGPSQTNRLNLGGY